MEKNHDGISLFYYYSIKLFYLHKTIAFGQNSIVFPTIRWLFQIKSINMCFICGQS